MAGGETNLLTPFALRVNTRGSEVHLIHAAGAPVDGLDEAVIAATLESKGIVCDEFTWGDHRRASSPRSRPTRAASATKLS